MSLTTTLLWFTISTYLIYHLCQLLKRFIYPWENCPPGSPLGLPFDVTNLRKSLETIDKSPLLAFHHLIEKYGPVIRISMGSQVAVLLGGLEEIKEFTALEETTGRPYNKTLLDLYSAGEPRGFGIGNVQLFSVYCPICTLDGLSKLYKYIVVYNNQLLVYFSQLFSYFTRENTCT